MSTDSMPPGPKRNPLAAAIGDNDLIDELEARDLLSRREANTLKTERDLSGLYEADCDCSCNAIERRRHDSFDESAAEYVRELIMRNDLAEALIYAERVHPHLDGLVRLSPRGA